MTEDTHQPIPDQRCFTTGEACKLCLVQQHTLRYWEQVFPQLAHVERRKNRRYYSKNHILTIRQIANLKQQGLTTKAILRKLKGEQDKGNSLEVQLIAGDRIRTELQRIIKLLE